MYVFQVRGVDVSLEVINNRQTVITDKLIGENEKFQKVSEEYKISDMIQKTKQYQQKLSGLQKEMVTLSERSANMKTRAMRLQEAKQNNQDAERAKDILPAAVKALYSMRSVPNVANRARSFVSFYGRVEKTKILIPMIADLKKTSKNVMY